MNIKVTDVLVLISASSGLFALRGVCDISDRYGILTVTPLDKYTGAPRC